MFIVLLLILRMMPMRFACLQTIPGTTPSPTDCCPEVPYILTSSNFPDGTMTFAYNNNICRTQVTATCSSPDNTGLVAAIVGNTNSYLEYAVNTISAPFTCVDGTWTFTKDGSTLSLTSVECILTNPAN